MWTAFFNLFNDSFLVNSFSRVTFALREISRSLLIVPNYNFGARFVAHKRNLKVFVSKVGAHAFQFHCHENVCFLSRALKNGMSSICYWLRYLKLSFITNNHLMLAWSSVSAPEILKLQKILWYDILLYIEYFRLVSIWGCLARFVNLLHFLSLT